MNDNLVFGRNTYYLCVTLGFLCTRFVWGRIVSVSEGVSGKKSLLLLNALPCANKNMVLVGTLIILCHLGFFAHAFCLGGGIVSVSTDVSGKRSVWFLRWARSNSGKKSGRLLKRSQGKLHIAAQRLFFRECECSI